MTKLIFMGTPDFAATVLEGLLDDANYDVLAVVTQPDRAVGRKKEIKMTPVKEVALAHNLPVYQPEKMSGSDEMAELMTLGCRWYRNSCFWSILTNKIA
jgi:methionyl-tRNA formyltransferase